MTELKKLQKFVIELKGLIDSGPTVSADNISLADEYLQQLRGYQATLNTYAGHADALFSRACIDQITNCEPALWMRVKNSGTMQNNLCKSNCPEEWAVHSALKDYKKTLEQASSHYITLISFAKESLYQDRRGVSQHAVADQPVKKDPLALD